MFKIMEEARDSSLSRDLLHRFTFGGRGNFLVKPKEDVRPENIELSLGLSLNGRFGVEPQRMGANVNNKLHRASSVTDFVNFPVDVELSLNSSLPRTCSLPPESAVEWKKRKELQSFRRSEAKRKRVEKLKNVRVVKEKTGEDWEANRRNLMNGMEMRGVGLKQSPPSPTPPPPQFSSQGSIGSEGSGGSSGVSDLDSQPFSGINKDTMESHEPKMKPNTHCSNDQTMPCVSTKGDGPNGRRIHGFLYQYGKGEDVRIVCVCHGSFLTPAEFVKHGGGGDVENPLRHIIVNSSSF